MRNSRVTTSFFSAASGVFSCSTQVGTMTTASGSMRPVAGIGGFLREAKVQSPDLSPRCQWTSQSLSHFWSGVRHLRLERVVFSGDDIGTILAAKQTQCDTSRREKKGEEFVQRSEEQRLNSSHS